MADLKFYVGINITGAQPAGFYAANSTHWYSV